MASDAKVSQVDELTAYAGKMQGFMESVSGNCTTLSNLMVQKLDSLRKKKQQAEQIEEKAVKEYYALLDAMAKLANDDVEGRRELLRQKSFLENKKMKAKLMRERVATQVNVAQGATWSIIEGTKKFQNNTKNNTQQGQKLLKKSVTQLEQYKSVKY